MLLLFFSANPVDSLNPAAAAAMEGLWYLAMWSTAKVLLLAVECLPNKVDFIAEEIIISLVLHHDFCSFEPPSTTQGFGHRIAVARLIDTALQIYRIY